MCICKTNRILREILKEIEVGNKIALESSKTLNEILLTEQYTARATREILEGIHHGNKVAREILEVSIASMGYLAQIESNTHPQPPRVITGVIRQIGNPMLPIAPGNSPQFQVTVAPVGATVVPSGSVYTISPNSSNSVATQNTDDPTGLTVTVAIPADAVIPFSDVLIWTYTNADGTTATASFPLVDSSTPVVNVTGGTIAQIV